MAAMSNYLEGEIIKHIFRTGSFVKPTTLAIALLTTGPNDADTGAFDGAGGGSGSEVANSNGYTRQTLNPLDANWAAINSGNGTTSNSSLISFPQATGSWGTVVAVAIVDSATYGAGNMLFYGTLSTAKTITTGDTFQFGIGDLQIQIDN